MDFYTILEETGFEGSGEAYHPYAGKKVDGSPDPGWISIDWLNTHFGMFDNATDMIEKARSYSLETTVMYFEWLVNKGKLHM